MDASDFDGQLERIKFVTGTSTHRELAVFLGIRPSSIADAKRRRKIPSDWLIILMRCKGVHPEWILTGNGPNAVTSAPATQRYETADEAVERRADAEALCRLSSRMLADELLRRIAVSQESGK